MDRNFIEDRLGQNTDALVECAERIAQRFERGAETIRGGLKSACAKGEMPGILAELGRLQNTIGNTLAGLDVPPLTQTIEMRLHLLGLLAELDTREQVQLEQAELAHISAATDAALKAAPSE